MEGIKTVTQIDDNHLHWVSYRNRGMTWEPLSLGFVSKEKQHPRP